MDQSKGAYAKTRRLFVIAHDMRSTFNVDSLLRTAEGLGIDKVYFTGYTPYPKDDNDSRLPHIADKLHEQIHKTALGAEEMIAWEYQEDIQNVVMSLRKDGVHIIALEQAKDAIALPKYTSDADIAVLLGTEVTGIPIDIMELADETVYIPMFGSKESFNVVQAAAMTLYHLRFR